MQETTGEPKRCGAKTRSGKPCRGFAVSGRDRCRMHGGTIPRGLALPQTKHGRYSKDLPTRMLGNYQAALADPDTIALGEAIALVRARIADLLGRVDTGEAGAHWRGVRDSLGTFRQARRRDDAHAAAAALREMERLTDLGMADYRAWAELMAAIEEERRLVETERRRLEAAQQTITAERAMLLVVALQDAVRRHVDDQHVLTAIGRELARLVVADGARPGSGTGE